MDKKKETEKEVNEAEEKTAAEEAPETQESAEDKLRKELSEQKDKYLRLLAEYDNYQKRTQREKAARYADAVVDTVEKLLPIEGVEMVMKQFYDALEKLGVKPIKAEGEQFDPNVHNAVMHIEDENVDDNTVVEDFQKGYIYNDERVVRHSMVKVAN